MNMASAGGVRPASYNCRTKYFLLIASALICTLFTASMTTCNGARSPAKLDSINYAAAAKFQISTSDGDTFQCVTTSRQPALVNNPRLQSHVLQWTPNYRPQAVMNAQQMEDNVVGPAATSVEETVDPQLWVVNRVCPTGMVPVRDNKPPPTTTTNYNYNQNADTDPNAQQVVGMYTDPNKAGPFYGASANITFWQPQVETPSEVSRSSMRLYLDIASNAFIETGWEVHPRRYGDSNARWFVDSSMGSSMDAFVQVSNTVMLGGSISPLSRIGTTSVLYAWDSSIYLDPQSKNWWLSLGGVPVGYWPAELFPNVKSIAEVEWVATIADSRPNGAHTTTQMGNGNFPIQGPRFGNAASYRGLRVINDVAGKYVPATDLRQHVDNPNCYNILPTIDEGNGLINFYYGGSGKGSKCP